MKKIELSQGQIALVDDEDYERLALWKWSAAWRPNTKSYYAVRSTKVSEEGLPRRQVYMHRQILGLGDDHQVDHRNHDTLDNRRGNLRAATPRLNQENSRRQSKYGVGVAKDTRYRYQKPYKAQAWVDGKYRNLGLFATAEEAKAHRDKVVAEVEKIA